MARKKSRINCRIGGKGGQLFRYCYDKPLTSETVKGLEGRICVYFDANAPDPNHKRNQSSGVRNVTLELFLGSGSTQRLVDPFTVSSAGWNADDLFNLLANAQVAAKSKVPA